MKKRSLLILFFLTAVWFAADPAWAQHEGEHSYTNGICTIDGCTDKFEPAIADNDGWYQLGNVGNVEWFAEYIEAGNLTAKAVLTADIDYEGKTHTPIGQNETRKFNGVFDGQHHHIKNLTMTGTNTGFFGYVRGGSTIRNIIIDATCSFTATERCGSLIGVIQAKAGGAITISNVVNYASVTSGSKVAGGILAAGATNNDHPVVNMSNCVNVGRITCTGADKAAGLLGWNKSASISTLKGCYNIGECTPLDGVNNLFRGTNRAMPNCYDLTNTTAQGKTGTQGLKTDWLTLDPLHRGELCYVLNTGDMSANGIKYTQDLSDPNSIPLPIPGKTVYQVIEYNCDGSVRAVSYNNTAGSTSRDEHVFDPATGLCTRCSVPLENWLDPEADGYYHLSTPAQVEWFSQMVRLGHHGGMDVMLDNDIDFGGVPNAHLPIGTSAHKYWGHFDGQGHRIIGMVLNNNLVQDNPAYDGMGFFGSVRGGGTDDVWNVTKNDPIIENLIIDKSCSIAHTQNFAAGVVAHINTTNSGVTITIRNCGNEANVTTTGKNAAGILGSVEGTNVGLKLYNLWNKGNITGNGGESAAICAWTGQRNVDGEVDVKGCWNIGEVTGVDGNGYNLIRRNTNIVPRNIVDLCTTNAGNQGKVAVLNTENPISSGELCYLLNGDQTNIVYTQTLGTDEMPVYGTTSLQVYQAGTVNCLGAAVGGLTYNNVSGETTQLGHNINLDWGMCDVCHAQSTFQAPELVDGYYELRNAGNVEWYSQYVAAAGGSHSGAKLMNDIDFYNIENLHSPIGPNAGNKFNSTFDGQGYSIKNMIIERPSDSNIGFFGWLRGGGGNNTPTTVKNLIIDGSCSIHGYNRVGGVTGTYQNGGTTITIENVVNEATVTAEHQDAGGIFGGHEAGNPTIIIRNVLNTGTITAKNEHPYAGALCCYMGVDAATSVIENFVNLGTVNGHEGGNMGRHNISNVKNLIDLSDTDPDGSTAAPNAGFDSGLEKEDIANGKLAYTVGWGQLIGTDVIPSPLGSEQVLYVGAAGYTTLYDADNDWELNGDAQAYIGSLNGNYLHLSEIDDVPAGTAVIIGGTYYNKVSTTATANATGNSLLGSDGTVTGGSGIYALANKSKGVGFYPVSNSVTIPAGKVYLQVAGNAVREFYPFGGEETTSLNEELRVKNEEFATAMYDLSGRKVNSKFKDQNSKLKNGIYIQNSKKVLF